MTIRNRQSGIALVAVLVFLLVIAAVAALKGGEEIGEVNLAVADAELRQVEYVVQAGMQRAVWMAERSACTGDFTVPVTSLDADNYTATATGVGSTTSFVLPVDQDAWNRSDNTSNNQGTSNDLHIRFEGGNIEQPLVRFDLSALPVGAQINSASVWFYVESGKEHPEGPITLHRITSDWTETGVTWDSFGGAYDGSILGMIPAQDTGAVWVQVNLTAQVQAWVNGQPNFGILLNSTAEGVHAEYTSREGPGNQHPRLEVTVGTAPAAKLQIQATGTLSTGMAQNLYKTNASAYQSSSAMEMQPGAAQSDDAEIWEQQPLNNYGNAAETWVSSAASDTTRTLLRFNTDAIPAGAKILRATLFLTRQSGSGANQPVSAHRITNSWSESLVSWNFREFFVPWGTAGGDFDADAVATTPVGPANQRYEWDITPLVQGWNDGSYPNYGVALVAGVAGMVGHRFYTSDQAVPDRRPGLSVTYACECGTACLAPSGSGTVTMIVGSAWAPSPADALTRDKIESWGYNVDLVTAASPYTLDDDVIYVAESASESDIGTKLDGTSIGIVYEQGDISDELGVATNAGYPVGASVDVVDTSHHITQIFPAGPLNIYSADMEGMAVAGTASPALQPLANWGGAGGLAVLPSGAAMAGGGTAPGPRVMLPFGRQTASDRTLLNNNGWLMLARSLEWASDNAVLAAGNLLMVVVNDANLTAQEDAKKLLIEGWGYTVNVIDQDDNQSDFDTALAATNVVFITEEVVSGSVGTKLVNAPIGVVNEEGGLVDEFGFAPTEENYSSANIDVVNMSHYITLPFALGALTVTSSNQDLQRLTGSVATGLDNLAQSSGRPTLATIDVGGALSGGGNAAGRRVQLPWGGSAFDFNALNADGLTIFRRALEWGAGTGSTPPPAYDILLIVGDLALSSKDTGYKALMESWGHTVALIDDGDSQANYDAAMAAADVIYASGSALGASIQNKATDTTKGLVNEVPGKIDNFGFSSVTSSTLNFDTFSSTDSLHYITEPFSGNPVTVFTSSLTNPVPAGTLAPGMSNVAEVSGTLAIGTLDIGATRYDSNPSQGRRVHLPYDVAETTDMTADGQTIMQRALEWAAGADTGGGGGGGGGGLYVEAADEWTAGSSSTWETMDLSTFGVPADAVVEVSIENRQTTGEHEAGVRAVGASLGRTFDLHEAEAGGVDAIVVHVQANGSSRIEHFTDSSGFVTFRLLGYWTTGSYTELGGNFTASASGGWQTQNLSSFGVAPGQIVEMVVQNNNGGQEYHGGVRKTGSGNVRMLDLQEAENGGKDYHSVFVEASSDASASIEVHAENSGEIEFKLAGVWDTPPGTYTEAAAVDLGNPTADSTWQTVNLSSFGVPPNAIVQITMANRRTNAENQQGVRSTASSFDRFIDLHEPESGGEDLVTVHVEADTSSEIQWYHEDVSEAHKFYLMGWWD